MLEEAQAGRPGEAQKEISAAVWQLISDALAAGAATLSTTAAAAASQPVSHHIFFSPCIVIQEMDVPQEAHHPSVGTVPCAILAAGGVTGEGKENDEQTCPQSACGGGED